MLQLCAAFMAKATSQYKMAVVGPAVTSVGRSKRRRKKCLLPVRTLPGSDLALLTLHSSKLRHVTTSAYRAGWEM